MSKRIAEISRSGVAVLGGLSLPVLLVIFWIGALRYVDLPGVYMDAVNPDYIAARLLNPEIANPVWVLPTSLFPILGNLYHGMQNMYFGLPIFWVLGTNLFALRLTHALFGAAIVALVYLLLRRVTSSRLVAFGACVGLATDVAFLASFRTQNYIILGGMVWLLCSLIAIYPGRKIEPPRLPQVLASGALFGLAVYGYFVFLFFAPAILVLLWSTCRARRIVLASLWCAGLAIGLIPYLIGYISMMHAVGGVGRAIDFLVGSATSLAPLSSTLGPLDALRHAGDLSRLALTNGGNEAMLFGGSQLGGAWPLIRLGVVVCAFVASIAGLVYAAAYRRGIVLPGLVLVLLPCAYLLFGMILGNRLWAHHYSVLVPLAYLIIGSTLHFAALLFRRESAGSGGLPVRNHVVGAVAGVFFSCLVIGNINQQNRFFGELERTGGVGKASSALTRLAEDALIAPGDRTYLFPEWGFFMSFAFLTSNRVPYVLEVDPGVVRELALRGRRLRLLHWDLQGRDKYALMLRDGGARELAYREFRQRDGAVAFYMIEACPSACKNELESTP